MSTSITSHKATLTINGQPVERFTEDEGFTTRAAIHKPFTISLTWLLENDACNEGAARFCEQNGLAYTNVEDHDKEFPILSLIGGKNTPSDLLWLVAALIDSNHLTWDHARKFLCEAALIVSPDIEHLLAPEEALELKGIFIDGKDPERITRRMFVDIYHRARISSKLEICKLELLKEIYSSVRMKDVLVIGGEFENAKFPQDEFNRLITELLNHAA